MPGRGGILLGARDQLKLDIILKVEAGRLSHQVAAQTLKVSSRTLRRYISRYRAKGILFGLHGNKSRIPPNKTPPKLKEKATNLLKDKYFDFNMTHALERINEELDVKIKREVFRKWCHEAGIVKRHKKRRSKPRYKRPRMAQTGLLIQMDGSHHRWFGGMESCLIATIDDATGEIPYAEFFHGETTLACLKVLCELISKKGRFNILYVDKAGVYGGIKRTGFSQVERALHELGSQIIYANSPEGKGRIERLFQTLQDRLIPEMRLAGVKTIKEANHYLQNIFLPQTYNPRFINQPENPITAYAAINPNLDLNQIFCIKEYRKVGKDHTISYQGIRYMLNKRFPYSLANQRVEIRITENSKWHVYYGGEKIQLIKITKIKGIAA